MFIGGSSPSPDDLAGVKEHVIAVQLALDGAFDARIAELKELKRAIDAKKLIASTIEEARELEADAEARSKELIDAAEEKMRAAVAAEAQNAVSAQAVAERERAMAERQNALEVAQKALASAEAAFATQSARTSAELAERERLVAAAEARVKRENDAIEQRKRRLEEAAKVV